VRVLLAFLLLLSSSAEAEWLYVSDLSLDYVQYFSGGRAPLISLNGLPDRELGQRIGVNLTLETLGVIYWANRIEGVTDRDTVQGGGQFRAVGWEFDVGFHMLPQLDVFYHHHSQHCLDQQEPFGYPVEDGVGIRLKVISK
jgi:hypothetical protein